MIEKFRYNRKYISFRRLKVNNMDNIPVWISISGLDKKEFLEGIGFVVEKSGFLKRDGRYVKSLDGDKNVHYDEVKAVVPGSLTVITDVSEVEEFTDEA